MDTVSEKENPILTGNIWKQLLLFAFPIMIGSFFQQLYNTIDSLIVGNFVGADALAAVGGSSALIVNFIVNFFMGLSSGAGVIISQYYGAGDRKRVNDAVHTAYAFALCGGVVLTVVGVGLSANILALMDTPEDIFDASASYLRIYFFSLIFMFVFNMGSGILRALGNSKTPLYFLIVCSIINIVLDVIFVLGLGLGVSGVAFATLLAQVVSAILMTHHLMFKTKECRLNLRQVRFDTGILKSQLRIGIPGGLQSTMYSVSNMIVQTAVNGYGTMVVAGWTSDGKIETIFWLLESALGISITTFVGQNYGAGKKDRIVKGTRICLVMYFIMSIALSGLFIAFRYPLIGIFTDNSEAIEVGASMLLWISPFYVFFAFVEVLSGTLRGMGDVVIPTVMTLISICVVRILWVTFVVPHFPGLFYLYILYPITWGTGAIAFIIYYLYRKKKLGL
ncbi:MAG: MATE family efflux transporter [Lachnospiraceae bacterium]|nr:MATE family efflux transporter [Lachnospiraceae bacterium]